MVEFVMVEGADVAGFQAAVNARLQEKYVFAGNIVVKGETWYMPMVKLDEGMDAQIARQLWGLFIAKLF